MCDSVGTWARCNWTLSMCVTDYPKDRKDRRAQSLGVRRVPDATGAGSPDARRFKSPVGLPAGTPTSIHEQHNAEEIYRHYQDSRHEWKGELRAVGFKDGCSHGGMESASPRKRPSSHSGNRDPSQADRDRRQCLVGADASDLLTFRSGSVAVRRLQSRTRTPSMSP